MPATSYRAQASGDALTREARGRPARLRRDDPSVTPHRGPEVSGSGRRLARSHGHDPASTRTARPVAPPVLPLAALTATGVAAAGTVAVGLAAIIDAALSPGLGLLFGFVFVLWSVLGALRIGWQDAWAALALPPLVFVAAAGIAAQLAPAADGGWLRRTSADIASAVLDHPFYLLVGTALAAAAIAYRARVE